MGMRLFAITLLGLLLGACAEAPPKPAAPTPAPTTTAAAQPQPQSIEEACKLAPIYQCTDQPIHVTLIARDGSKYDKVLAPPSVIVQNGYVSILAGQTLYIEADVDKDTLTNLHYVTSVTHPDKTLTLKFEQTTIGNDNAMSFTISNPFGKPLKYHAGMMPLDGPDGAMYKTSTCPVVAKGGAFETWPQPLFQLVLSEFHLLDPDSKEAGLCIF